MSGGEWTTRGQQREAREAEREHLRLMKRHHRDLRWAVERSELEASDWADLLALQAELGKEGPLQLWRELVPYWRQCQTLNGGADLPSELFPQAMGLFPRATSGDAPTVAVSEASRAPVTRTKPGKGASRKVRSDAGIAKPSRKGSSAERAA
jgi:hypothetical protein